MYGYILNEQWTDVLNLLYTHKNDIATDVLLQRAATIFEQEFFKKVKAYPAERTDIDDNLGTLYLLIFGKFYTLTDENYKTLILELVKRKPIKESVNYARLFPDEEICREVIAKFELLKIKEEGFKLSPQKSITMNWIEIYNRLFELMNNQADQSTYFSGTRFINTIREVEPYFPDYGQFINQRNSEGKSTSRKIYYYDILIGLKADSRSKTVYRFLEMLKPFQKEKVEQIEQLLQGKSLSQETISAQIKETAPIDAPVVFISYSWDNDAHKEWVLNLANYLCTKGVDVLLDRYELKAGKSINHFVENSIAKAKKVIVIFTPNYRLKADKRTGGVGFEYSIMNVELYNNQTTNEKIIPVLRNATKEESIPTFMQQYIHLDMRNDNNYETSVEDLLREIYDEPVIVKPELGAKPEFGNKGAKEEITSRFTKIVNLPPNANPHNL